MTDKQIPNERRQYEYKSVFTNTDKQIIKPRPICLYEDTCLHLKEKTRSCEDCVHYKNYWDELLEKEQVEKIKSLEQECEKFKKTLAEIKEIAENMNEECFYDDFDCMNCDMQNGCTYINKKLILQKISECEVENEN